MLRLQMESGDVPCWCEISFRDNPLGIAIRVHKDIAGSLEDRDLVPFLEGELSFGEFSKITDEGEFFGFDHAGLKRDAGEFVEIFFAIPRVDIVTEDTCPRCKGSGEDSFFKRPCSYCEGTKKKIAYDYNSILAVSASLSVLFMYPQIYSPNKETTSKLNQLIILNIVSSPRNEGGSDIGGAWSMKFCNYFRYLFNNPERAKQVSKAAEKAMKAVYYYCYYRRNKSNCFWVQIGENTQLSIGCPGGNCRIIPQECNSGEGCDFYGNEVDTQIQQLSLLTALCVIHDEARKDGW